LQKAKLAETVQTLEQMDYHQLLTNIAQEAGWILLKVVIALVIYFIGRQVIKWVVRIMDKTFTRHKVEVSLRNFLRSLVKVLLMVMLLLAIVQTLGVNTSSFLALFASAGLAIGMALSGTLQNFAGGVMILILRPYRVGDFIEAQGVSGTVASISLFNTVVLTGDKKTIYIPNNSISTSIINNYSTSTTRRCSWKVSVAYGDDYDQIREAMLSIIKRDGRALADPAPYIRIDALADSAVVIEARAWVKNEDYWGLYDDVTEAFYKELPQHGANFPFPQLDVHLTKE
jgi:small conductance mechanosensitive channel